MPELINEETRDSLKKRFEKELINEVELIVYTNDENNDYSNFTKKFIKELAEIDSKIKLKNEIFDDKAKSSGILQEPCVQIGMAQGYHLTFYGVPSGYEAGTIVDTVSMVSQAKTDLSENIKQSIKNLDKDISLQVFVTPSCPHCPHMAHLAFKLALENPERVSAEVIEASEYPELSKEYGVSSVPQQLINWQKDSATIGVQTELKYLEQILAG